MQWNVPSCKQSYFISTFLKNKLEFPGDVDHKIIKLIFLMQKDLMNKLVTSGKYWLFLVH